MEKFTAAQARELMPSRFNEMIERIHNHIRNMAVDGGSVVTVTFSSSFDVEGLPFKVKDFLEKEEGYGVFLAKGTKSIEFYINWRDDKNF
jgi:UDP:flavonoid glycosyltransferase YjiC (YdhE family)